MGFAATVLQRWALRFSKFIPKVMSVSSPSGVYRWPPDGAPGSLRSSYPSCFLPIRITGKYQGQDHFLGSQVMALLLRSMKNNNYHALWPHPSDGLLEFFFMTVTKLRTCPRQPSKLGVLHRQCTKSLPGRGGKVLEWCLLFGYLIRFSVFLSSCWHGITKI